MLYFDHTYCIDPKHKYMKRLGRLGFTLYPSAFEHPGELFCRFIMLPQSRGPRRFQYLEFIDVRKRGSTRQRPGISFGFSGGVEKFVKAMPKTGRHRAIVKHKNYDWKLDSRSRLPGWNFVSFPSLRMRGLYPWLTEYEPKPGPKSKKMVVHHANGVHRVDGFEIELNAAGVGFFEFLFKKRLKPEMKLADGTTFYFSPSRRTHVNSVILESRNLSSAMKKFSFDDELRFNGQRAVRIEKGGTAPWDILII